MNKKGFTLIELLGVVTLIVLVSLIVIPNLLSSINKKRGEISSANMQLLASAADVYIDNHSGMYANSFEANGSTYCIPLQTLIDAGILETPFKDASGKEVDYSDVVKATYNAQYNGFQYEFVKKNTCSEVVQYVSKPELASSMIPVVYEDGVWKKADANSKWYNYSEKKWANAVLVREWKGSESGSKSRYEYLEAPYGTVINEFDILAYFVWIPRFRYQLFNSNIPISINIVFESVGTNKSTGTQVGQWLTHPAFSIDNQELSGIWVAKYEVSNLNDKPAIKPEQTVWKNYYKEAVDYSDSFANSDNIYGLFNVNSHLIRNSEWSAVSYLTSSMYGCGFLQQDYDTYTGMGYTTTGNNYGIYGMSDYSLNEFVSLNGETEDSYGYSLVETKDWASYHSFITTWQPVLLRGKTSIYDYASSYLLWKYGYRISLVNNNLSVPKYDLVNFDAQGGNVDMQSKIVKYSDSYGDLPTPTRSGFTFIGWSGKNLFDKSSTPKMTGKYVSSDGTLSNSSEYSIYEISVSPNTKYALKNSGSSYSPGYIITDISGNVLSGSNYSNKSSLVFTTPENAAFVQFSVVTQPSSTRYDLDYFQIECNDAVTFYEDYNIVTSGSTVDKNYYHTLYANWKKN